MVLVDIFFLVYIFSPRGEYIQNSEDNQSQIDNQTKESSVAQNISFAYNFTEANLLDGEKYGDFIFRANHPDDARYDGFYGRFSGEAIIRGVVYINESTTNVGLYVDEESLKKLPQFYFSKIYNYTRSSWNYNLLSFGFEYFFGVDQEKLKATMDKLRTLEGEEVELKVGNYILVSNEKALGPHATVLEVIHPAQ